MRNNNSIISFDELKRSDEDPISESMESRAHDLVRTAEVYSQIAKDNVEESVRVRKYGNIAIADIRHVLRVYPRVSSSFRDIRSSHIRCIVTHPADARAASRQMSAVNRDLMIRFLNPIFVLVASWKEKSFFYIWMRGTLAFSSEFSFLPFNF